MPFNGIDHALKRSGKPIVVLMGEMTGFGAYCISMAAGKNFRLIKGPVYLRKDPNHGNRFGI